MAKTSDRAQSLVRKYTEIFFVVSAYWIVSISMVFLNKLLLSSQSINLPAPFFITLFQCLSSALICLIAGHMAQYSPKIKSIIPVQITFDVQTAVSVFPLSIIFVLMITLNNFCLKNVEVAFYFVGRSLTTVFNVILTYIVLKQKTSVPALICCGVIVFGFFLGCDQEGSTLSISGVLYGTGASFFVSLNAIHTKKTLPAVHDSVWLLSFYNNVISVALLALLMLFGGEFTILFNYEHLTSPYFWFLMSLSGFLGFAIGFVTGLQIQVTTPLTHNISGTAKAAAQTVLAVAWFSQSKTALWWLSNCLVLFGSAFYARVKQLEMQRAHELSMKSEDTKKLLDIKEQV